MPKKKGSANKATKKNDDNKNETKVTKPRGRQKGETKTYLETLFGESFKTKEDEKNRTLYQKCKPGEKENEEEESEPGWKSVYHYSPREDSWQRIFDEIVQRLKLEKAKKESTVTFERHKQMQEEAEKKAMRLFRQAGFEIKKMKG